MMQQLYWQEQEVWCKEEFFTDYISDKICHAVLQYKSQELKKKKSGICPLNGYTCQDWLAQERLSASAAGPVLPAALVLLLER